MNRLRVEHGKILRVYQFQRAFVQIHEQVFPIAPSPNHVQKIVSSQGQVHDAFVDGLAASLGRQIFLRDFSPPEERTANLIGLSLPSESARAG